ncbi:MAG TPA: ABC transporter permease [candidate division Zixibacteria bacterium]|nr:ABC transporter permease [candidate division Zixibacteria bacterium]
MLTYAVRRVLWLGPVLFVASVLTFLIMHWAPGSPWLQWPPLEPETVAKLDQQFGLDRPLHEQYLRWMSGVLRGDFGETTQFDPVPVGDVIAHTLPISLHLGGMAFVLALLLGVPLGVVAALNHGTVIDYAATGFAILGMAAPSFALGVVLQLTLGHPPFHEEIGFFPRTGWGGPEHWVLPTIALAALPMAQIARFTRASMLDVIHADYVRTAHSKGVPEDRIVTRHMIRNALIPIATITGPLLAVMLTGSIVVERLFEIPGMGNSFLFAIQFRDYTTIMGVALVYAAAVAVANMLVDLAYGYIDPRIRDH